MRTKKAAKKSTKRGASRLARTLRSLVYIVSLGVVLAVYNAVSLRRDIALAIGPESPAQREFFEGAADRPDITTFFKKLTPDNRLKMAQNIGRYDDAELATLCGKCLDTFDPQARLALTDSLAHVALAHPDAVAIQFKLGGSFQQLAIANALRKAGPSALPLVDKQLSVGDARPNAVSYLVSSGHPAIAPTLPYLSEKDKDTRLAAVDALGKLRATEAVPKLIELYKSSKEDESVTYFTALATIGEPSTEPLMTQALTNDSLPTPLRAQAALGLGRIASTSALTTVWSFTSSLDQIIRESAISALQLAGDKALKLGTTLPLPSFALAKEGSGQGWGNGNFEPVKGTDDKTSQLTSRKGLVEIDSQKGNGESRIDQILTQLARNPTLLLVAGGIHTPYADSIIQKGLEFPEMSVQAARVAGNRPELVPILLTTVRNADATTRGDVVDSILRSLTTTAQGRTALEQLGSTPAQSPLSALAARRLKLGNG